VCAHKVQLVAMQAWLNAGPKDSASYSMAAGLSRLSASRVLQMDDIDDSSSSRPSRPLLARSSGTKAVQQHSRQRVSAGDAWVRRNEGTPLMMHSMQTPSLGTVHESAFYEIQGKTAALRQASCDSKRSDSPQNQPTGHSKLAPWSSSLSETFQTLSLLTLRNELGPPTPAVSSAAVLPDAKSLAELSRDALHSDAMTSIMEAGVDRTDSRSSSKTACSAAFCEEPFDLEEFLIGDPWDGCEDLRMAGLRDWHADFIQHRADGMTMDADLLLVESPKDGLDGQWTRSWCPGTSKVLSDYSPTSSSIGSSTLLGSSVGSSTLLSSSPSSSPCQSSREARESFDSLFSRSPYAADFRPQFTPRETLDCSLDRYTSAATSPKGCEGGSEARFLLARGPQTVPGNVQHMRRII